MTSKNKTVLTPEQVKIILDRASYPEPSFLELGKCRYSDIVRVLFPIEPMPDGARPYHSKISEPRCTSVGHPGKDGPASECPHPDCVVKTIMES